MKNQLMKGQKQVQADEAKRFDEIIKNGFDIGDGIAIDGGAHVGSFTVPMSYRFDEVYAFEPCNISYDLLVDNVERYANKDCHVKTHELALMDRVCDVHVKMPSDRRTALTARQVNYGGDVGAVSIDCLEFPSCDFIKLDLEGAECLALDGARETIKEYKPWLMVEMNGLGKRFGHTDGGIELIIECMGYRCVWAHGVDKLFKAK